MFKKLFNKFFKQKSYIRFYSLEEGVLTLYPIIKSSALKRRFMETEQIGDLPETLSSKNCPGIKKIISAGWIVPAPADFSITTNGDGASFEWNEPYRFTKISPGMDSYVSGHTRSQTEPLLDDPDTFLKSTIKIETPWRVEASDDVMLLLMPVSYNNEPRFRAATGILDPKYGHLINVQLFWNVLDGKTVIKAGTPLCQIIPISRRALSSSAYDITIDVANATDERKEQEFNYASKCAFLHHDKLSSRLGRIITVLNKYKQKEK